MPIDSSEMDVGAQADIVDLVPVELAVGRVAAEVLQEEPEVPRHQEAVELHAGAQREVEVSSPGAAPPRAGRAAAPTARTRTAMPIFPNVMSGFLSAWLLHPVQERPGSRVNSSARSTTEQWAALGRTTSWESRMRSWGARAIAGGVPGSRSPTTMSAGHVMARIRSVRSAPAMARMAAA